MSSTQQGQRRSPGGIRAEICARLEARRAEIEETILTRAYAVSDPLAGEDADYLQGVRLTATAAVEYGFRAIAHGEERAGPVPAPILSQARYAAQRRVGLQVVLRRYASGYSALSDFLMQEAGYGGADAPAGVLYPLQRELTSLFDRLVTAVSIEYEDEASRVPPCQRLAERVKRLLAGELVDIAELDYDIEAWHVGAIASGPGVARLLHDLAARFDRRLLLVADGDRATWAWLGGRREFDQEALAKLSTTTWPLGTSLALGEPGQGSSGWRLTHRQAAAALAIARHRPRRLVRYGDVALLATILRDEDLIAYLTETYLSPLAAERDGGETLRKTLRAYFSSARNVSSAAAALGVTRQTVTARLRVIEERLRRSLDTCGAEIEAALRLADATETGLAGPAFSRGG